MRLTLPGLAGEVLERWDGRGNHWRMTYDDLLRVTAIEVNAQPETETFTFATASADAGRNLRGNLLALQDRSGGVNFDTYSLLGQALAETRTFADGKTFTSRRIHGPLGSVLEQVDASGHRQRSYFDLAGQLRQVQLKIDDQAAWATVLEHARYNAAGQIILQQAGNGVISHWAYDQPTTTCTGKPHRKAVSRCCRISNTSTTRSVTLCALSTMPLRPVISPTSGSMGIASSATTRCID